MPKICITPRVSGVGGMVSFQHRLAAGLSARGVELTFDLRDRSCDAVLVIGGTRHLGPLWLARRRGVPVVQRLDGMNWIHRQMHTGWKHYLRAEYGNMILRLVRNRFATGVVYQSGFSWRWWERVYGPAPVPHSVVYNGVDLQVFSPDGPERPPDHVFRLLLVEGRLQGGYEQGLDVAIKMAARLASRLKAGRSKVPGRPVELTVVGRISPDDPALWQARLERQQAAGAVRLQWAGQVRRDQIPAIDRSAHLLYSADVNAACPNSVIEALACGLPVVAFDTGSLPELVQGQAGRIAPYGGDPWRLEPPDVDALTEAALEILSDQESFRRAARGRAEAQFGLDSMLEGYLQALLALG